MTSIKSPELLAPAGNWECAQAAIENGADAIYFGLQVGFNARARATNFSLDNLPELMRTLHRRGVLGYVTLNTLVFTDELKSLEANVRHLADSGVDAVLVQDLGAARLIHRVCPDLDIHASTQMTMTSAETIAAIESLNIKRVVLARELSIAEIGKIVSATPMPVECFIHGALCVAYSGQCLTSESLGGRSANRGQCAQACRLDYKLYRDGQLQNLGDNKYLLSPQDLAGYDFVPQLIDAGVQSLKIEGRLKTPEYVANTVHHYRQAIDAAVAGRQHVMETTTRQEIELSFSRGLSPGWLEGCNHKRLVPGLSSTKRGVFVGTVVGLSGEKLLVDLIKPIAKGDGLVLEGDRTNQTEIGGRVYEILVNGEPSDGAQQGRVQLLFQHGLLKDANIKSGLKIWQTDDPRLTKRLRSTFDVVSPNYRKPVDIIVHAAVSEPLRVTVQLDGHSIDLQSDSTLSIAQRHPLNEQTLRDQFGRLGGTPFYLRQLTASIDGTPMAPFSLLGQLRHQMIQRMIEVREATTKRIVAIEPVTETMLASVRQVDSPVNDNQDDNPAEASIAVLCRSLSQLQQVLECGVKSIYVDFHDIRQYKSAVGQVRETGGSIYLAPLRIQKPGEIGLFKALAKQDADGWLVRNLAALRFAKDHSIPFVCDFSLNVTNPLTAQWLMEQGAQRVTASYDLNRDQLNELVDELLPNWLEVVVHQHMPMFHMEHCVFCTVMSPGTNKSNCGRPCDRHAVELEDRIGVKHVLHADIGCRNTLFNGVAQSGAEAVQPLMRKGVRHFRIELLNDAANNEIQKLISLYSQLAKNEISGRKVWETLKADNRLGVTRGTLEQPRNPLAIL